MVLGSIGVAAFFLSNSVRDFQSSAVQTTQDTSRYNNPNRTAGDNGTVPKRGPFLSLTRVMKRCHDGTF